VLDILAYIHHETTCWLEITTLLIPGKNDSPPRSRRSPLGGARTRAGRAAALHRLPPRLEDGRPAADAASTLTRARRIAIDAGLHYVYTGNVHDTEGGTTFCPAARRR
jgi:pyruvate formate lyase activating enzyme